VTLLQPIFQPVQILGKRLKTANRARISVLRDGNEDLRRPDIDPRGMGLDATKIGNRTPLTSTLLLLALSPIHGFPPGITERAKSSSFRVFS
jgi:hypothetical protein